MAGTGSKKVVLAALGANAAVAASKLAVGLMTGSVAMLAEAAHSFADTVNQGFLLVSIRLSKDPADEEHPFGHGKERFFWAFLAAVFIFIAGAFFSLYEGIQKLFDSGEHTDGPFWPSYLVLAIAFAVRRRCAARSRCARRGTRRTRPGSASASSSPSPPTSP